LRLRALRGFVLCAADFSVSPPSPTADSAVVGGGEQLVADLAAAFAASPPLPAPQSSVQDGGAQVVAAVGAAFAASPLAPSPQSVVLVGGAVQVAVAVAAGLAASPLTPGPESAVLGGGGQLVAPVGVCEAGSAASPLVRNRRRFCHRASLVTFRRFGGDTVWCPIETAAYDSEWPVGDLATQLFGSDGMSND